MKAFIGRINFMFLAAVIVSYIVFFIHNTIALDPDLGWHLRVGEYVLKNGLMYKDVLSYTMTGFLFVDHEWLSNVFIRLIYGLSPVLLVAVFALFPTIAPLVPFIKQKTKLFHVIIFLLSASLLLSFSGIRTQTISWIFASVLLALILKENLWKKWRYFVPLMILFWANLHGAFAISIYLLSVFLVLRIIQKKVDLGDFLVVGTSIIATFINPYGVRLWGEIFAQVADPTLRGEILEWLPGVYFLDFSLLILLALFFVMLSRYRKKINLIEYGIFFSLLILTISSIRHFPFLLLAMLIIFQKLTDFLYQEMGRNKYVFARFSRVCMFLAFYALAAFCQKTYAIGFNSELSQQDYYPVSAISYIEKQKITGEIFSVYNWGGYLDWKLPTKKVFIDGRMPSWRWYGAPESKSSFAFRDYADIALGAKDYKNIIKKYNIDYVLWPAPASKTLDIDVFGINISLANRNMNKYKTILINLIKKDKWEKVYGDKTAVIYKKV